MKTVFGFINQIPLVHIGSSMGMDTEKLGGPPEEQVIFSLIDGQVYVTWPGTIASLKLGTYEAVSAMMEHFLAQNALGRRLNGREIYPP